MSEPVDGLIIDFPAVIKAVPGERRVVEVEASVEKVDSEGDLILQKALLDASADFIRTGHLDIDHYSELGDRLGIPNPESWIVGRPTEVKDIGNKRTSVVGEIMRAADGVHNPTANHFDAFWDSLLNKPPVVWRASVYGFPKAGMLTDCRSEACGTDGPSRFLIEGMDWRSLAFTRSPVNDSIKGHARIITAKAFLIAKAAGGGVPFVPVTNMAGAFSPSGEPPTMKAPTCLADAADQHSMHIDKGCEHTGGFNSAYGFARHFEKCCGMDPAMAELYGHALMHHVLQKTIRV